MLGWASDVVYQRATVRSSGVNLKFRSRVLKHPASVRFISDLVVRFGYLIWPPPHSTFTLVFFLPHSPLNPAFSVSSSPPTQSVRQTVADSHKPSGQERRPEIGDLGHSAGGRAAFLPPPSPNSPGKTAGRADSERRSRRERGEASTSLAALPCPRPPLQPPWPGAKTTARRLGAAVVRERGYPRPIPSRPSPGRSDAAAENGGETERGGAPRRVDLRARRDWRKRVHRMTHEDAMLSPKPTGKFQANWCLVHTTPDSLKLTSKIAVPFRFRAHVTITAKIVISGSRNQNAVFKQKSGT